MALDFPNSPSTGSTYTVSGRTWEFNGSEWVIKAAETAIDAKGDLLVGSGDNSTIRLPAGVAGDALMVDPDEASGLAWSTIGQDASTIIAFRSFS